MGEHKFYTHNESGRVVEVINRSYFQLEGDWIEAVTYITPDNEDRIWSQSVRNFNAKFTAKE